MSDDQPQSKGHAVEKTKASDNRRRLLAQCAVLPEMRHAAISRKFTGHTIGEDESDWHDTVSAVKTETLKAAHGDLETVSRMLISQAMTLDAIFTNMAGRAAVNMGHHPEAVKQYTNMALRAQANSRATLEALARIHQPREQIVRHVNVNEGGQAVFANQIHQNGRKDRENEGPGSDCGKAGQPHEPSGPLLGKDEAGNGVPISRHEGEEEVPAPRREIARRSDRSR